MTERSRMPAEWELHRAVWIAWPSHADLWGDDALVSAQTEVGAMAEAIAEGGAEALEVLCRTEADQHAARARLGGLGARFHRALYGDIWLRDTAPLFVRSESGVLTAATFRFNGWGDKYELPGDRELSGVIAALSHKARVAHDFVLEGGAIEVDGEGTILTTRQCLRNPNRNPSMSEADVERALMNALGGSKVLWLEEGLLHDHTDGHVDTIARFVAPGRVVCMAPSPDDPNADVLRAIARELGAMTDARGRRLDVVAIPSPGRVASADDHVMPASHVNFYVGNTSVVVPTYGTPSGDAAVAALEPLFEGRRVVGRSARTILQGGGAFHCITQQEPA